MRYGFVNRFHEHTHTHIWMCVMQVSLKRDKSKRIDTHRGRLEEGLKLIPLISLKEFSTVFEVERFLQTVLERAFWVEEEQFGDLRFSGRAHKSVC